MTKTYIRILRKLPHDIYVDNNLLRVGIVIKTELFNKNRFGEFFKCKHPNGLTGRKYRNTLGAPYYEHVSPLELLATIA